MWMSRLFKRKRDEGEQEEKKEIKSELEKKLSGKIII
jgi:hypothetical protein